MIPIDDVVPNGIPDGWRVMPFWLLFRREKKTGFPEEELLSVYRDHGVVPKSSRNDNHNKESEDLSGYQLVTQGTLVTNKMKAWQGSIAISRHRGIVSPAYYVYLPLSSECDQFLHYFLRSDPYIALYRRISKGVRVNQWDLEHEALRNIPVALPDLPTQRAIADFLDRETARIDLLIVKKQRLVELLGEKFQTLRHTVITRGAPERHETVDGPNQWFDRVPKSWAVKPLRHVVLFQRGHDLPSDARTEGKYPIYSSGGISGTHSMCSSNAPGIVTGRYGTIGKFHFVEEEYWALNTSLYSRKIYEHPKYVFYLLEDLAHIFILNSSKSAVPGVDRNDIHSELVPVPSRNEQVAIAEHLDALKCDLGTIEVKTNASIDRLKEYRSALITATVTGQINVAEWGKAGTNERQLNAIQAEMEH